MSLIAQPGVGAGDRLSFTLFVAIALHALLIIYDFIPEDKKPLPANHREITISLYEDAEKPKEADFLAETNQQGSGQLEEKAKVTSRTKSVEPSPRLQESSSLPQKQPTEVKKQDAVIVTKQSERNMPSLFERVVETPEEFTLKPRKSILERSLEIAELEASLDNQIQNYARRPRVTRLTAASTMKALDARYVESIVQSIELIGKQHFPEEAGKRLYGQPSVSISIYSDGTIKEIRILRRSGNLVLDAKTKEIIRRAAPFPPFPKEIRKERDVLELIRTFSYQKSGLSSY